MVDIEVVRFNQFEIRLMDEPCSCRPDEVFPFGGSPVFLTDPMKVVLHEIKSHMAQELYGTVHLNGKHVLAIYDGKNKL